MPQYGREANLFIKRKMTAKTIENNKEFDKTKTLSQQNICTVLNFLTLSVPSQFPAEKKKLGSFIATLAFMLERKISSSFI